MSSPKTESPQGPIWQFRPGSCIEQPACPPIELARRLRAHASGLGLVGLGFAPVGLFKEAEEAFVAWVKAGYPGTMNYLVWNGTRGDPNRLAPGSETMVVAAMGTPPRNTSERQLPLWGQIAAYAGGPDYHGELRQKLAALGQLIADYSGQHVAGRACVDTAPLLEREAARRAGVGFIGKSNMLIIPGVGSQVLLGVLLVNVTIQPDEQREQRCGRCEACLSACPTHAFVRPWLLDATRCIAYLTIEYQGWIAHELRPLIGMRIFGCDVCQDVCPFNHGQVDIDSTLETAIDNQSMHVDLKMWLRLTSSDYRRLTTGTAMRRVSRWQLLRNAAVAAGNSGDSSLIEPLAMLLMQSKYPIVRGHSAWALGRFCDPRAEAALGRVIATETDPDVIAEIKRALCEQHNVAADHC